MRGEHDGVASFAMGSPAWVSFRQIGMAGYTRRKSAQSEISSHPSQPQSVPSTENDDRDDGDHRVVDLAALSVVREVARVAVNPRHRALCWAAGSLGSHHRFSALQPPDVNAFFMVPP